MAWRIFVEGCYNSSMPVIIEDDVLVVDADFLGSLGSPCANNPGAFTFNASTRKWEATCGGIDHRVNDEVNDVHEVAVIVDKS